MTIHRITLFTLLAIIFPVKTPLNGSSSENIDWKQPQNWANIKAGLSDSQVENILGTPIDKKESPSVSIWHYQQGSATYGSVKFIAVRQNRTSRTYQVQIWKEPDWDKLQTTSAEDSRQTDLLLRAQARNHQIAPQKIRVFRKSPKKSLRASRNDTRKTQSEAESFRSKPTAPNLPRLSHSNRPVRKVRNATANKKYASQPRKSNNIGDRDTYDALYQSQGLENGFWFLIGGGLFVAAIFAAVWSRNCGF